jgi:hypothetical protein
LGEASSLVIEYMSAPSDLMHFHRIAKGIDPVPVLDALQLVWDEYVRPANCPPDGNAADYPNKPFEYLQLRMGPGAQQPDSIVDLPPFALVRSAVMPTLQKLTQLVGMRTLGAVWATRLYAGREIAPHVDEGIYNRHFARFHFALTTNPDCIFTVGGETAHMEPGELWWINQRVQHGVRNAGPDRIHLMFDAVARGYSAVLPLEAA